MKARDKGLLSFASLGAAVLFVGIGSSLSPKGPSHPVLATVTNVYVSGARFPRTAIVARAPGTIEALGSLREDDVDDCRVGDIVEGKQTGISLRVDPYTCRRPAGHPARHR